MELYVYAGPTILKPEKGLVLTFGKTYRRIPENLPEILKECFVPLEEYPKVKKVFLNRHREILKALSKEVG